MKNAKKFLMPGLWIFLLLLPMFSSAMAGEKINLQEVVVTATRHEEEITKVPAKVTVITGEDIRNSTAQNIPDILRLIEGVHVSDIAGNRRNITVDLRGFGETASHNTLVLIDGRRVNQVDLSGTDWFQIPVEMVKKIEVIRGGRGSVLYGDNATGGVINIITKGGDKLKGGSGLSAGSHNTFKGNAYVSGGLKNADFYLSGGYSTSDGYRDNSNAEAKDFNANLNYYAKDFLKLNLSSGYHKDTTGLPGALKESDFVMGASRTDSKFPNDFARVEDYYFKVEPAIHFSSENVFQVGTSFRKRASSSFSSGDWGSFLGDSRIKTLTVSPQLLLRTDAGTVKNTLTAGVDYQKADNDIINDSVFFGFRTVGIFDLEKKNEGYYIHDEIRLSDTISLSGGYRYDRAGFAFYPGTPEKIRLDKSAYTAGINYTFYKRSYAYLSFSRGFRYPLLDELYSFFTNTVATQLIPQKSANYEFGVRHYFSDDINAHLNIFRLDTDYEIFFNPATFKNENLNGMTRRDGLEFSFSAKACRWLGIKGSYTYLDATIKEGSFQGKDIPNVPGHKTTLEAISHLGKGFTLTVNGVHTGRRPFVSDFANTFGRQKDHVVLNSKLKYEWKPLHAFLDINNLTNKEYAEYGVVGGVPAERAFYPSPKRNILIGLSVEL